MVPEPAADRLGRDTRIYKKSGIESGINFAYFLGRHRDCIFRYENPQFFGTGLFMLARKDGVFVGAAGVKIVLSSRPA